MNKKQIPLYLQDAIEPLYLMNKDVIGFKKEANCFYSFYDVDRDSDFFFKIYIEPKKAGINISDNSSLGVSLKPASVNSLSIGHVFASKSGINNTFKAWIDAVRLLSERKSIYDDPFLKSYEEFFKNKFKLDDEDADYNPFSPEQQEYIDNYLSHVETKLLEYRETVEEQDEKDKIDNILTKVQEALTHLGTSTKEQVWNKVVKIWAMTYVWKRPFAKDIMSEAKSFFIQKLLDSGVKYVIENYDKIL